MRQLRNFIPVLVLMACAFTVSAQKVSVGAHPAADLTKYKTYAWDKGQVTPNPIIGQMIVDAVDAQLAQKGLRKVETDPELTVVGFGSVESDLYMSSPSWAPSLNSLTTGIGAESQSWPVSKGTLVVDITDAKTKSTVWRGSATQTLQNGPTGNKLKDAKTVEKPIKKSVEKMFKQFPHPKK